jgi:hypothetical protein
MTAEQAREPTYPTSQSSAWMTEKAEDGAITVTKRLVSTVCINIALNLLFGKMVPTIIASKRSARRNFRVYAQTDCHKHEERGDRKGNSNFRDEIRRVHEV